MRYRKQIQHWRRYKSGKSTLVNRGIYYKKIVRMYRRGLISKILFHNSTYGKEELLSKTVAELQEIWNKTEREKYGTTNKSFGSAYLAPDKREVFTYLGKRPEEVGGYLDFNKKGLENITMFFGKKKSIQIPPADYETGFHTHIKGYNFLPSSEDIKTIIEDKKQAELIFHQGAVIAVLYKKDTRLPKGKIDSLLNKWNRLLSNPKSTWNDFNDVLNTFGLEIKLFSKGNKGIRLPIKVIEPKKRTVWYK